MKKLFAVLLALTMACSFAFTAMAEEIDWSQYPETFEEWDLDNLESYFRATGVFCGDFRSEDMPEDELKSLNITSCTMYAGVEGGAFLDIIFYYNEAETEGAAAALDTVLEKGFIASPDGDEANNVNIDAVIGKFVFFYSLSKENTEHIDLIVKSMKMLEEHFGAAPVFF